MKIYKSLSMRKVIYKLIWYILLMNSTCGFIISPSGKSNPTNKLESSASTTSPPPSTTTSSSSSSSSSSSLEHTTLKHSGKVKDTPIVFKKCKPCAAGIKCVPSIQCPAHVRMHGETHPQLCDLPGSDVRGLCCTTGYNHTNEIAPHLRLETQTKERTLFIQYQLKNVLEKAELELRKALRVERSHQGHVYRGHPDFLHHQMFRPRTAEDAAKAIRASHRAMEHMFASKIFKNNEDISNENFQLRHFDTEFPDQSNELFCEPPPNCPATSERYRSANGRCNNIEPHQSLWGAAGTAMERLMPPVYEDGVWAPRVTATDGSRLTNSRIISRILFEDVNRPHPRYNLLVMQFGQFMSHDVTQSASITLADGNPVQCCAEDGSQELPKESQHFGCFPIPIDAEDSFYRHFNQGCMNFVRLSLAPDPDCRFNYAKQISKVTHYLDGSVIYGSDVKTMSDVRSFQGGQLRMLDDFGRQLLPLTHLKDACVLMDKGNFCFLAGDTRVNQIISLVGLHTVFAREHNRIASILNLLNPHWSDEILFQETKRIVVAEYQHIIYNEWLPIIVGEETMNRFDLYSSSPGEYANSYDQFVNPSITSEFSGAAFRFGHSTVDGKFNIHNEGQLHEVINIPDVMFKPGRMRQKHFYDELLKTLTRQPMQEVDSSITNGLSKFLFRGGQPFGLDLVSLNIQRGRDHALRPYNDYLELTGRARITEFDEFDFDVAQKLKNVYNSPDDIDLWVGGLLESAHDDALVGPTFAEIIADQFSKFKRGDRFFYEFNPETNPGYFELQQLDEIRKVTIARIICDNSDHFSLFKMSPNAFELPQSNGQNFIDCNSEEIPTPDLNHWRT